MWGISNQSSHVHCNILLTIPLAPPAPFGLNFRINDSQVLQLYCALIWRFWPPYREQLIYHHGTAASLFALVIGNAKLPLMQCECAWISMSRTNTLQHNVSYLNIAIHLGQDHFSSNVHSYSPLTLLLLISYHDFQLKYCLIHQHNWDKGKRLKDWTQKVKAWFKAIIAVMRR